MIWPPVLELASAKSLVISGDLGMLPPMERATTIRETVKQIDETTQYPAYEYTNGLRLREVEVLEKDGVLSPDKTFSQSFEVGLQTPDPLDFFVDVYGIQQ